MGGKTKQSQRTKNNARPSSSGRSAELMGCARLEASVGLVGIAGTQLPALFPSLTGIGTALTPDTLTSPELQLCFRKLNKKDPITKTKALQELTEVVSNSNVDEVAAALPSWTHFYKILTADPDRKVRECTQACHGVVARVCGRRLAPHLKSLMPSWLAAQYDEHAPAQTYANNSLAKTFPDSKLSEVVSFCKEEIMSSLQDTLLGGESPARARPSECAEERAMEAARAACSALHGVHYTVRHLPAAHDAWLWTKLQRLLAAPAFWSRATHTDLKIRAAWYGLVGGIAWRYKEAVGVACGARLLRVLVSARETGPLAAAPLWDCLLLVMHHVPDWHQYLENNDLLTKRILDLLESGGWGDARHLRDMVLPLLALLPPPALTHEFHVAFFDAILSGLDKKSIVSSKSERQAWIASLAECLRYVSVQRRDRGPDLVTAVHRRWLQRTLSDPQHLLKYSAAAMAGLLAHWLRHPGDDHYDLLVRNFWHNVGSTLAVQLAAPTAPPDLEALLDTHVQLLRTLKTSFAQEPKKQHSIKFETDLPPAEEGEEAPAASPAPAPCPPPSSQAADRYLHDLSVVVHEVCSLYVQLARERETRAVVSPLLTLAGEFHGVALFAGVARRLQLAGVYALYDDVLRPWLAGDAMRCREVAALAFLLLPHLTEPDQDAMFHTFKQFPPSVVEWCISLSLSHPHVQIAAARRWLRGPLVEGAVDALCRRLVDCGDGAARGLLMLCLRRTDDGESMVSPAAVSAAMDRLAASLRGVGTSTTLETCGAVAAQLATSLDPHAGLLTALLALTADLQRGDERLSLDTWCEVRDAWQDGVTSLPADKRRHFLQTAAADLPTHLHFRDSTKLDIPKIEHIVSLCPYLLWNNSDLDIPETIEFTSLLMEAARTEDPVPGVMRHAVRQDVLAGHLTSPLPDENDTIRAIVADDVAELSATELIAFLNSSVFRAMYLRSMLLNQPDDECDANMCNELLQAEGCFRALLARALHDYAVLCSLHERYAFSSHYESIESGALRLGPLLDEVVRQMDATSRRQMLAHLVSNGASTGYHWARAAAVFRAKTADPEPVEVVAPYPIDIVTAMLAEADITPQTTGSGFFNLVQAVSRDSDPEGEVALSTRYLMALRCMHVALVAERETLCDIEQVVGRGERGAALAACDDVIVDTYYKHKHVMLYEQELSSASWTLVTSSAAVCAALAARVRLHGWHMLPNHWDFANITLCSLLTSLQLSRDHWHTLKVAVLARSVLQLFVAVSQFVREVPARSMREQPAAHVAALPAEWADIYAPDLHSNLYDLLLHVLESCESGPLTACQAGVVDALARALPAAQHASLAAPARAQFPPVRVTRAATSMLARLAPAALKYLAHAALLHVQESAVLEDASLLVEWSARAEATAEDEAGAGTPLLLSLEPYHEPYDRLRELVETALDHVRLCEETCVLVADSDALSLALGWLLLADALARQCRLARGDLVHHYIQIYRERQYAVPLVCAALRLLPEQVLAAAAAAAGGGAGGASAETAAQRARADVYRDDFLTCPALDVYSRCTGELAARLACCALGGAVRGAGAAETRGWRSVATPRQAALLDHLVSRYVTPQLVRDEFNLLQRKAASVPDTEISMNWSSQEVTCVLAVDDSSVTLTVTLARQHPLVPPRVDSSQVAGSSAWLLMYLGYQDGRILDALKMWVRTVNMRMERAPQCYICYCRLHHATGRLPSASCHTCHNKFHGLCLRKWFETSNKMLCPLCRTKF